MEKSCFHEDKSGFNLWRHEDFTHYPRKQQWSYFAYIQLAEQRKKLSGIQELPLYCFRDFGVQGDGLEDLLAWIFQQCSSTELYFISYFLPYLSDPVTNGVNCSSKVLNQEIHLTVFFSAALFKFSNFICDNVDGRLGDLLPKLPFSSIRLQI